MTTAKRCIHALATTMLAGVVGLTASSAVAGFTTFSGFLNDAANSALVGSGMLPTPPSFADDWEIANNVALYSISLATAGSVRFDSSGFGLGGVDPYFTLFSGTGYSGTFVGSNYVQAFSTGGDFDLTFSLLAGDYTFAIGAFGNMSFAENGGGTLDDGFTGLGGPNYLGTSSPYYYEVVVTTSEGPGPGVPEPTTLLLALLGLGTYAGLRQSRR